METEEKLNVLDELSKGACMGMDAIEFILEKVEDKEFYNLLEKQYNDYKNVSEEIEKVYAKYSNKEPHETSTMNKVMTWYGINIRTLTDKSNSKISELLMQGTNMGIIEGRKLLNHNKTNDEIHSLIEKYVNMQEEIVERLKDFL